LPQLVGAITGVREVEVAAQHDRQLLGAQDLEQFGELPTVPPKPAQACQRHHVNVVHRQRPAAEVQHRPRLRTGLFGHRQGAVHVGQRRAGIQADPAAIAGREGVHLRQRRHDQRFETVAPEIRVFLQEQQLGGGRANGIRRLAVRATGAVCVQRHDPQRRPGGRRGGARPRLERFTPHGGNDEAREHER